MTDGAAGWVTHVGRVRPDNEDSVRVEEHVWVVADGMGGHEGGEHASRAAVETVAQLTTPADGAESLVSAIQEAHRRVLALGEDLGAPDMGTTIVAAVRVDERDEVTVAWVGDSRAYLLRGSTLEPLTEDHNEAANMVRRGYLTREDARTSPAQAWLTRCLGAAHQGTPAVDTTTINAQGRLLLCSDGLNAEVEDEQIAAILSGGTPQEACDRLLQAALDGGGSDNVTIVVVDLSQS